MARRNATLDRVVRQAADLAGLTDRDLLTRFAREGDQAAFAAVAARHTGMVLGVCRRTLSPADAEDACQALFLLLAEKAGRTRWQSSAAGWLYTTARRVARNARLAADRRKRRESRAALPESVPPADTMTGRELAAALDEELGRLPPRYRDPLVLCYLGGLTQDEAAARLGVPDETLRSQLKRGRKKLADALTARGCELGIALLAVAASTAEASTELAKQIHAAGAGSPSTSARELARAITAPALPAPVKSVALAAAVMAGALGLGIALAPPMSAQPPKPPSNPDVGRVEAPAVTQLGATRFRASAPIGDARYSHDGKFIVGYAGSTIYVWNPADGSVVRSIETKLEPIDDPSGHGRKVLAFAVHPKRNEVAVGGRRENRTVIQGWDFETGKSLLDIYSPDPALKLLAWTPDGEHLLERGNMSEDQRKSSPLLLVRNRTLTKPNILNISGAKMGGDSCPQMLPLPGNAAALFAQVGREPYELDLKTGAQRRVIPFKAHIPSGLALSPDHKTLAVTATDAMSLIDFHSGKELHTLPVLRDAWEKPRPLFSADSKTVFVWDSRPMAYDVATGKEKWRATFRTYHTAAVKLADVSPDGKVLLCRHGHRLLRLDAATGKELDPPDDPSMPADLVWAPDGSKLFTRTERHDRTWVAWDATTGKRLFDLQPTGLVPDDNWKLTPDLFFIHGGKEIVTGLERAESNEQSGPKELVVFDTATGKCLRRLGGPLPDEQFRWTHPVAVEPDGSRVLMQAYAVSRGPGNPPPGAEDLFRTVWWDPAKNTVVGEWDVAGYRSDDPRHFGRYCVMLKMDIPEPDARALKAESTRVRCYSLADGKIAHEWATGFTSLELDRLQGNFLLAGGYDSKWTLRANTWSYTPSTPVSYDLWELPSHDRVPMFDSSKQTPVALGPGGLYVLRVRDSGTVEVFEPFVLKDKVATITPASRPVKFEFSPDGRRVAASLADTTVALWETADWRRAIDAKLAAEVPDKLNWLWECLAADPPTGLRATRLFAAAGDRGLGFLQAKVSVRKAPDAAAVGKLINDLDAPRFAVRERAEAQLRDLGAQAEPILRRVLRAGPSAEVGKRIEGLLADLATGRLSPAQIRDVRAVQALVWMNTPAARAALAEWAKGDPAAALTQAATSFGRNP